ncbi:MAG: nicotinamidase [Betaproteobacteria bacterium]|nr:nicotinamidase [Betaproteobacteria bacterium]
MTVNVGAGDALLVVDTQRDFLPGGSLAVPDGDAVVPVLNRYIALAHRKGRPVFASRCWHPKKHCSFKAQGGPWPDHCVAGTPGAEFAPGLELPREATIISKATSEEADAYSAFSGTDLARDLRDRGVKRLLVGGLATDYCVLNSVRDALKEGFSVLLLTDAIRAVNVKPGDGERARREMEQAGAVPVEFGDVSR